MPREKDFEKDNINQTFIAGLERKLKEKRWTRNKLKQLSGVNLERYKTGDDMRGPSLASAVKIADALQVSLDDLCGRRSYMNFSIGRLNHRNTGEDLEILLETLVYFHVDLSQPILLDDGGLAFAFPKSPVTESYRSVLEIHQHLLLAEQQAAKCGLEMEPPSSITLLRRLTQLSQNQKSAGQLYVYYSNSETASPDSEEATNTSDDGSDNNTTE